MIPAILRIVLDAEDHRFRPEAAVGDRLDHAAERQIVVGDLGSGRGGALVGAAGMIVRQADDDEAWPRALCFEFRQFANEEVRPELVGHLQRPANIARRIVLPQGIDHRMTFEQHVPSAFPPGSETVAEPRLTLALRIAPAYGGRPEFAVVAQRPPMGEGIVPKEPGG